MPFVNDRHDFSFHTLNIKWLTAILRVVVNNNRVFNANAIANFHRLIFSVLSSKLCKAYGCLALVRFADSFLIFPQVERKLKQSWRFPVGASIARRDPGKPPG